jgi:Holliday junction resolvasome RuvABC endonuclease subunit
MAKRILALDGALNHTGWAVLDDLGGTGFGGIKIIKHDIFKPKATIPLGSKLVYNRQEIMKLVKVFKPDVVVCEDVFVGKNAKTSAKLNHAKGVLIMTVFEILGEEAVVVEATTARACLGFSNNKEGPFRFFKQLYNLKEDFVAGNDITDALTLGFWFIIDSRGECFEVKKKKETKPKRVKTIKKNKSKHKEC